MKRKIFVLMLTAAVIAMSFCLSGCGKNEKDPEITDTDKTPAVVDAKWAEDEIENYNEYDEFTADTYEYQSKVLFTADRSVKNFNVLALTMEDVDDDGNVTFSEKSIHTLATLKPERPLMVRMTFEGTIPNYGISYTDTDGSTKRFAVQISGKDGSIILSEF